MLESALLVLVFLVSAIPSCLAHEKGPMATPEVGLFEYLIALGISCDCYFTIEQGWMDGETQNPLEAKGIGKREQGTNLKEELEILKGQLEGVEIVQDRKNTKVIHLIDSRLLKLKTYPLDREIDKLEYTGEIGSLPDAMRKQGLKIASPTGGIWGSVFGDSFTIVTISAKNLSARAILTQYIPLARYSRVLWDAKTNLSKEADTEVMFRRIRFPHLPFGVIPGPLIDFKPGEAAYEKVMRQRQHFITSAIEFIKASDKKDPASQVRWAMRVLGDFAGLEGIPILLDNIDYEYANHGVLEERYPVLYALQKIGKPAVETLVERLAGEAGKLRRELMCAILTSIIGSPEGIKLLGVAVDQEADADKRANLQAAVKCIQARKP